MKDQWIDDFLEESIPEWKNDPVQFIRETLMYEPDDWQKDVAYDLRDYNRVSVKSGHGVGKTCIEASLLLWFLTCFPYARVVATAPTQRQLHDVLWAEIDKWMNNSVLLQRLLKWTKTYIYVKGYEKRWFAVARTATKPENMQGFHEDNMLFIVDEASGVSDPIMETIMGTLTGDNNKLLLMGNPTRTRGVFYDSHTIDRAMYRCHTVNAENCPRTNKENIASMKRKYGEDSNVVRVRVYGEFPQQEDDVFIPLSLIEQSVNTEYTPRAVPSSIHIGCDVARFGNDKTVIGYKVDEKAEFYRKRTGQDTMATANDIIALGEMLVDRYRLNPAKDPMIPTKVDDGGVGGGVVDRLRQIKENNPSRFWWLDIIPIGFGRRIQHNYYYDTTTYMMAETKKLLQPYDEDGNPKAVELILPNDEDLIAQLSERKYLITDNSKMRVESKEAIKERGMPSPDEGDCILLLSLPVKPKMAKAKTLERSGVNHGR